jgi:hypothetical protein
MLVEHRTHNQSTGAKLHKPSPSVNATTCARLRARHLVHLGTATGALPGRTCGVRWQAQRDTALVLADGQGKPKAPSPLRPGTGALRSPV